MRAQRWDGMEPGSAGTEAGDSGHCVVVLCADSVCDVVDDNGRCCSSIVHGRKTVVALLCNGHTADDERDCGELSIACTTHCLNRSNSLRLLNGVQLTLYNCLFRAALRCDDSLCRVVLCCGWLCCCSTDLSRCVPYFELHHAVRQLHGLCEERCADGTLLVLEELTLHKPQHERRLAHCTVTQQHLSSTPYERITTPHHSQQSQDVHATLDSSVLCVDDHCIQ